jgi:hypothetical protein
MVPSWSWTPGLKQFFFICILLFSHLLMCIHCLGHLPIPHLQRESVPPSCSPISLKKKHVRLKKKIALLLSWNKASYTERFLALLPCTCILQPTLAHLCQTSSLLPGPLPIVASSSLRWLYSLLYSEHINHIQVLGFLPSPIPPVHILPLVCDPCPIILLHFFGGCL